MPLLILFAAMLSLMLMRVYLPLNGARPAGRPVATVSLSFMERALMQRVNTYAIGLVLLLTTATGVMPRLWEMPIVMIAMGILFIPVRYVITTEGIGLNNVVFRPWSELASFSTERRRIRIEGREGTRPLMLTLLPGKQQDVLPVLRRYLKPVGDKGNELSRRPAMRSAERVSHPIAARKGINIGVLRHLITMRSLGLIAVILAAFLAVGSFTALADSPTPPPPCGGHAEGAGDPCGDKTGSATDVTGESAPTLDQDTFTTVVNQVGKNKIAVNFTWTLFAGALVLFFQSGFALVETGFTRAKNAAHTMMMNFVIFAIGGVAWFVTGFALMFGGVGGLSVLGGGTGVLDGIYHLGGNSDLGLWGTKGWFLAGNSYDVGVMGLWFFQLVFMDTAGTIVTGAMAERWKFSAFIVYSFFMAGFLYPLFGNWAWGGGWLAHLGTSMSLGHGYVDFAGSGVVHAVGGLSALAGAIVIGPRLGKYNKDGTANTIPGHSLVLAILGVFILLFGWLGFNAGSTLAATELRISSVIVNTVIASCTGLLTAMYTAWLWKGAWGKPDPGMACNGMLAGLVAITAPSGFVAPWAAFVIGAIAGVLVVVAYRIVDTKLKIDDPVGAFSVHGVNGLWGVLAVGLFADGTYGAGWNGVNGTVTGLFYGDAGQLGAQAIGVVTLIIWAFGGTFVFMKLQDMIQGIRVSPDAEIQGLDLPEMGVLGYAPDAAPHPGALAGAAPAGASGGGGG